MIVPEQVDTITVNPRLRRLAKDLNYSFQGLLRLVADEYARSCEKTLMAEGGTDDACCAYPAFVFRFR